MISTQFAIGTTVLTRKDIAAILSTTVTAKHSVEQIVNPADKQNVSLATDLLITFSTAVKQTVEISKLGFRVVAIVPILKLLGMIMEGVLALYAYVTSSVDEQLVFVSTAAHGLLVLKKIFGAVLPNQLYHDLMSTFQNVMFCAAKFKAYHPDEPFLIVFLGSDGNERTFGNLRLKFKHNAFSALDIITCARLMKMMSTVFDRHPDWTAKSDSHEAALSRLQ